MASTCCADEASTRRYDGERHTIGAPPYGMRLGAGRGAVPLLCAAALLALCLPRAEAQHVDLVAPAQGFVSRDGSLRIEWVVAGVPGDGGAPHVVLMVNGMVAQVASASDASGSLLLSALSDGPYRVHVFLGQYDEYEGLSNVQSSALVECWLDATGVLGGVPPPNPQAGMVLGFTPYVPATRAGAQPGRGPVVVFTYHCNRPDFVKMQADALRKFILDDFTLLVINDAQSDEMRTAISEASMSVGAESILTSDYLDHSDPSQVVGRIVTWSVQEVALRRFNDSVVMLLEGDMFPVAPFSPLDFLAGYQIAGTQQGRRHASSGFLLRCVHAHARGARAACPLRRAGECSHNAHSRCITGVCPCITHLDCTCLQDSRIL